MAAYGLSQFILLALLSHRFLNIYEKYIVFSRLLVNLTSAPHLCFEQNPIEEDTNDSTERKSHELELTSYLQSYKEVC